MDIALAEQDVVEAGKELVARNPDVGAIVLECTNMPPYAAALQAAVRLARLRHLFDDHLVSRRAAPARLWLTCRANCVRLRPKGPGYSNLLKGSRASLGGTPCAGITTAKVSPRFLDGDDRRNQKADRRQNWPPRTKLMMPEKSLDPAPSRTNRLNSLAASAPSGVGACACSAASCASFRSFSIIAAVKPAW